MKEAESSSLCVPGVSRGNSTKWEYNPVNSFLKYWARPGVSWESVPLSKGPYVWLSGGSVGQSC